MKGTIMSTSDTFLAVFLGGKTSLRMKAWNALSESERRAKEQEGIAAWKSWMEQHQASRKPELSWFGLFDPTHPTVEQPDDRIQRQFNREFVQRAHDSNVSARRDEARDFASRQQSDIADVRRRPVGGRQRLQSAQFHLDARGRAAAVVHQSCKRIKLVAVVGLITASARGGRGRPSTMRAN
jgi:hypothetical protein